MVTCSDGTIYTGYTTNLSKRISQHNSGNQGAKYTKTRRPVKLSYVEILSTLRKAMHREREIKSFPRDKKLELISQFSKEKY